MCYVNGTKHGTIQYVRNGFLLVCYSNFVRKIQFLRYLTSKMPSVIDVCHFHLENRLGICQGR